MRKQGYIAHRKTFVSLLALFAMAVLASKVRQLFNSAFHPANILRTVYSPTGKYKALIVTFDCGTLCDLENDVAVIPNSSGDDYDSGLVFKSFSGPKLQTTLDQSTNYPIWATLSWVDDHTIEIGYDNESEVEFKAKTIRIGNPLSEGETISVRFRVIKGKRPSAKGGP